KGFRFVGEVSEALKTSARNEIPPSPGSSDEHSSTAGRPSSEAVTFCRTKDGANIAVASIGAGPTLVRTPFLVTHIEYDWQHPFIAPLMQHLARNRRIVRYDGRGTGMSDRGVPETTPSTFLLDLEAVVDSANVERVTLLGMSGGAAAAIAFAARYPQRVSKLI